jgi:putative membrane protein
MTHGLPTGQLDAAGVAEFPAIAGPTDDNFSQMQTRSNWREDLANAGRGLLMGGADIIPGVSGGTVALILGIYERLVTAISRFDLELLRHLRHGQFREAARHVDLRFVLALGCGIATGIVGLASLMNYLITTPATRPYTLAAFFGMILASGVLVGKLVGRWNLARVCFCIAGGAIAFWITGLTPTASSNPPAAYVFLCGMIGICAMILPGISGAFILLLLGMYVYVTDALKALKGIHTGEFTTDHLLTIVIFSAGCAVGLLSFSKILRWLLSRHGAQTMAVLCGFMLGSLRKIWPFQRDVTQGIHEFKLKQFQNFLPDAVDGMVLSVIAVALVAMVLVFVLDRLSFRPATKESHS